MFEAPLHPKLVHVPVALAVLMPLVSFGLFVAWSKRWLPARSWWIAALLQAILFAGGWIAYETGESNEEKVEEVVAEEAIEVHEERAEQFYWASGAVLVLMILPVALPTDERRRRWIALAASAGTVVVFWLGYRVGEAGGALVYEHGAAQAHVDQSAGGGGPPSGEGEAHEEEEEE
ncbi:MAG: DUF2231 domain-containing protein [Bradymonadaceae bacterium]